MVCILLWRSRIDQLIQGYIPEYICELLSQLMDDFLLLWISLSLTFYSAVYSVFSTIISHSMPGKEAYTDSVFNHSYLFCHLLKKWNLQLLAGKDISKERGLTMNVTTKTAFLWCILLKALFLWWHKVGATSHISEDWKAACPHGNCSLLRAQERSWWRCCPPIAFRALHVFHGHPPDP